MPQCRNSLAAGSCAYLDIEKALAYDPGSFLFIVRPGTPPGRREDGREAELLKLLREGVLWRGRRGTDREIVQ